MSKTSNRFDVVGFRMDWEADDLDDEWVGVDTRSDII